MLLAGTKVGRRRRWRDVARPVVPGLHEWEQLLVQEGSAGGQSAHVLWTGPLPAVPTMWDFGEELLAASCPALLEEEKQPILPAAPCTLDDELAEEMGTVDSVELRDQLFRKRRGHAVPPWSAPRVAWKCLLKEGSETADRDVQECIRKQCVLIRMRDRTPLGWILSMSIPVDKMNAKSGCGRFRLLQVLDCMSTSWSACFWNRARREFAVSQYGFVRKSNRLHALLALKLQRWRLLARKLGCLQAFFEAQLSLNTN